MLGDMITSMPHQRKIQWGSLEHVSHTPWATQDFMSWEFPESKLGRTKTMTFSYNYDGGLIFHLQARVSMAWETWVTLLLPFAFHLSLRIFDPYSVTIYI